MRDVKLPPAVCEKSLRDHHRPMRTMGQNCNGAGRVKARKYTCYVILANTQLYMHVCTGRREEAPRLRGEQEKCWSSVMQYDRFPLAVFGKRPA